MVTKNNFQGQTKVTWKGFRQVLKGGLLSSVKDSLKSQASFGLSEVLEFSKTSVKVSETFKTMNGFGKSVVGLNVVASVADVADGFSKTDKLAQKARITRGSNDYLATQAGGIGIDTVKNVTISAASVAVTSIATAAFTAAATSVFLPVAAGIFAGAVTTITLNNLNDNLGITDKAKEAWVNFVGGKQ